MEFSTAFHRQADFSDGKIDEEFGSDKGFRALETKKGAGNFVISNVNIVNVETGTNAAYQDVIIRDGRISMRDEPGKTKQEITGRKNGAAREN